MSYFAVLSIGFGLLLVLTRLLINLLGDAWSEFELNKAYTEKQPRWLWLVGFWGLILIAFTWYKYLTTDIQYSIVITIIITATLVKIVQVLFNYKNFRLFAKRLLIKERQKLLALNGILLFLGLVLIAMGIFIY